MKTLDLSIVIPTAGRRTLPRCLESIKTIHQGGYGAHVLVVEDTYNNLDHVRNPNNFTTAEIKDLCKEFMVDYVAYDAGYHDWGYPQLDYGYRNGDCSAFIMNIGDDDVMVPDVLPKMVDIIQHNGVQPYMFQSILFPSPHRGNRDPVVLWNDESRDIVRKSVTGQNLVVPNIPHLFGQMTDDFVFIKTTIERWHGLVKWIPLPTCWCY